ncbi:MAG TPA: ribonuclease R [Bacteroidales bacterium]|nr:ribonuclease R [Bacteroidales bacterium]HPT08880.1 ribonuclease R [Bacteroidales bacterium]
MKNKARNLKNQDSLLIKKVKTVFENNPESSFNYKQVAARLGVGDRLTRDLIRRIVEQLFMSETLAQSKRGKYRISGEDIPFRKPVKTQITGKVDMKQTGKAYVIPEDGSEDIFIAATNTHHALHGDTVKTFLFPARKGHKREGEITEIIKRNKRQFSGIIETTKNFAFLTPDSSNMPVDLFIPLNKLKGAKKGQKVVAIITDWPEQSANPFGEVIQVLGKPGEDKVEMNAILAGIDFPLQFSPAAEKEAAEMDEKIPENEIKKRRDFRDVFTITIDPEDAKDFDDALSLKILSKGRYEVGVHIADVSYFVQQGSAIDREAGERGTSVYMVGQTIPMLPERLSNDLCSLKEGVDRLCFSAVFTLDDDARVLDSWYGKTIIHSRKRYSYEQVQVVIESGQGENADEILRLNHLALRLREKRFQKGSFNFETQEVRFKLDEQGKPLSIYIREMKEANKLIEDFMLLANRMVAEHIGKKKGGQPAKTFVYRVHDSPNAEKLETFTQFVARLGFKLKVSSKRNLAESYNQLFRDIKGTGTENMIETIAIRTMAKAYYTTNNIGHYGLAFTWYTHFTSPIRRYPDLLVHRLLYAYMQDAPGVAKEEYEMLCEQASEMERRAVDAERMSVRYKQAEYMLDKVGQEFNALISGVSKWGIFAEITGTKCEGMIRLRDLEDDYYFLDEENYQILGQRYGHCFKLGDRIRIRVKRIDLARKQMDYEWVG